MVIAFKPGTFEWSPPVDRDKDREDPTKTILLLATLSEHEQAQIDDAVEFSDAEASALSKILGQPEAEKGKKKAGRTSMNLKAGTRALCALRIGLKDFIRGPLDPDTNEPVEFKKPGADGMCPWENITILPPRVRSQAGAAIETGNQVEEDEAKN